MDGSQSPLGGSTRRTFLKTSSALAVGTGLAATLGVVPQAHAAGSDELKIGLVGCGGRGSGAIVNALSADPNCKLTAVGDAFPDVLKDHVAGLQKHPTFGKRMAVSPENMFSGFDAYKKVIDSGIDVVLLATPPHFRAQHLAYAVEKGKHAFVEKPVAVDPAGVRSILESCHKAKEKNLSVLSGLCYRYHKPKVETMKHVHDGEIGDIVTMHCSYNTGGLWHRGHKAEWSPMEYQLRNWLYFTWLSGDFICEQHVHSLDKMAWAMKDATPLSVSSIGGRQQRTDPMYGQVYDHFCSVFTYPNGQKLFSTCRQQSGCATNVNDYVMGTKGTANMMQAVITGKDQKPTWKYSGPGGNMYKDEHIALFESIRKNQPINNGTYMAQSTMLAIMARMSAYTGQDVSWEQAMTSKMDLSPAKYDWIDIKVPPVAIPGVG